MSLKEAIVDIVEEMEKEAEEYKHENRSLCDTLKGYARSLKAACKSAGDSPTSSSNGFSNLLVPPAVQHAMEVERAKSEFRKSKQGVNAEEQWDGDMVDVIGGPANPDGIPTTQSIDPNMPLGAYTTLAGGVYQLRLTTDNKKHLVYDEHQTKRIQQQIITGQ